ncbi:MAG TPA: enoyl-CoA hydratase family protein [Acidimicrobiia bacterium]|nr:enoyl-CoA hydratase family protein [Acidimicrobiia bacterium]
MTYRASAAFTQQWQHFRFDVADGVATVTFDRPDRLNALTLDVYADLRDFFTELEHRDDVAVVVVRGEGRGFCSGGDVEDIIGRLLEGGDQRDVLEFTRMTGAVVQAMRELPRPIVAALNGVAAGAGAVIALASDFRLLARSASFRFLFSSVGLAGADMGCAWLLPRIVGTGRATEILMLGDRVTADDALAIGLANRVVDNEKLDDETTALARRLADGPTFAYAATKLLLTREADMSLQAAIELEAWTQAYLMRSADHAEFFEAQAEKRPPSWTGR